VAERDPREQAPTPAEVASEVVELGRMVGGIWLRGVESAARAGLAGPARVAVTVLAEVAKPTADAVGSAAGSAAANSQRVVPSATAQGATPLRGSLRDRGAELLRRSADVDFDHDQHPAYRRMLDELAPDEARILRLLYRQGPQPAVDVRAGLPPASRMVRPGLSMIGAHSGCRHPERVDAYLDNLSRLGLAALNRDPDPDPLRYQLLEAQPEVVEALAQAGRTGRTVRRTFSLTTFGLDFCAECLPPPD